jgi:hypothetical protein
MLQGLARRRTGWAAFLAALLVSAQIAVAAEACAMASVAAQAAGVAGCSNMPMERDACLARCISEAQAATALDQPADVVAIHRPVAAAGLQLSEPHGFALFGEPFPVPRSPPLRVLFCSYRT